MDDMTEKQKRRTELNDGDRKVLYKYVYQYSKPVNTLQDADDGKVLDNSISNLEISNLEISNLEISNSEISNSKISNSKISNSDISNSK